MAKTLRALKKPLTNKDIARHWHSTAYPGEAYDRGQREYFEDMLADHHEGNWQLVHLPVNKISGHHSGHDASEAYVNEFAKLHSTGSDFPPIIAKPEGHNGYRTIDGQHRLKAAQQVGQETIRAYIPAQGALKKMSQPRLSFPGIKGMDTRPDQDVRQIATERQKKIYGKVIAQNQLPDKEENYSTSEYNPQTKEFTHSPTIKRKVSRQTLRDKYAKRVASRFGRNTLGTSSVATGGGKSFNAALSGAQRTKFEGHEPTAEAKEKHAERHDAYRAQLQDWIKRADELKAEYNKQDNPNGRLAAAHVYNQHIKKRPRRPRKVTVGKKDTKSLTPEQQILRGKNVDTTIEHEAGHATWRQLESKAGKLEAREIKGHLIAAIPRDLLQHLVSFVEKRGYKTKDPHFTEEILTHARDILTSPTKRQAFEAHVGPEKAREQMNTLKRTWKDIVTKAKGFSVKSKDVEKPIKIPDAAEIQKGQAGDWQKEGYTLRHEHYMDGEGWDGQPEPHLRITAHDKSGQMVGSARFQTSGQKLYPVGVAVGPDHQRKGLGSAMYAHAEKVSGKKAMPSDTRTNDSRAMWDSIHRPFGKMELNIGAESVKVTVTNGAENVQYEFKRGQDSLSKSEGAPEEVINLVQNATGLPIG